MTSVVWTLMLMVTATALLFHFMPRFSRPDILFGVTVPEAFVTGAGRTLISRYQTIVGVSAAATLAILLLLKGVRTNPEAGVAVTLVRRSRRIAVDGPAAAAEQRFRRVNALGLVLGGYAAAILTSAWTVESIPAFGDALSGWDGSCRCR